MPNQSLFVKIVIWFMVFLMSIGFVGLVIAPFVGNSALFGGDPSGRDATREQLEEARADVRKDDCTDEKKPPKGERLERCKDALERLGASYRSLATPTETDTEAPRDSRRNLERAGDAWQALYELDPDDEDSATLYASYLRDSGKAQQSLDIWQKLVKENPQNEDYLLQLAGTHQALGDIDQTIATYRLFIRRFPDSGQVEQIREEIKNLQEQQEQQAAGGGAIGPDGQPITVG